MRSIRAAVDHYEQTSEIRGPKTGAFARCLLGNGDRVVLDVWMAKAFRIPQSAFNRPAVRARCEHRIAKAGERLGLTPAETQAAVWTAIVRDHGRRPAPFRIVDDTLFGGVVESA